MKPRSKFLMILVTFALFCMAFGGDINKGVVVSTNDTAVRVNDAGTGEIQMLLTPEITRNSNLYLGRLLFLPGGKVAEHVHQNSAEMVYVISGSGTFRMGNNDFSIRHGSAIYIPAGTAHSFENTGKESVEVIQFYSPAGPEERFKSWKIKK